MWDYSLVSSADGVIASSGWCRQGISVVLFVPRIERGQTHCKTLGAARACHVRHGTEQATSRKGTAWTRELTILYIASRHSSNLHTNVSRSDAVPSASWVSRAPITIILFKVGRTPEGGTGLEVAEKVSLVADDDESFVEVGTPSEY